MDPRTERKHSQHKSRHKIQENERASSGTKIALPPVKTRNRNKNIDVSDIMSASNMDSRIIQDISMTTRYSGESQVTTSSRSDRSSVQEILKKNSGDKQPLKPVRDSSSRKELLDSVNSFLKQDSFSLDEDTPSKMDLRDDVEKFRNLKSLKKQHQSSTSIESTRYRKNGKLKSRIEPADNLLESETRLLGRPRLCSPDESILVSVG